MKHSLLFYLTLISSSLHAEFTPLIYQTTTFDDPNKAPSVKILSNTTGLNGSAIAAEEIEKSALFELFSVDQDTNTEASHDKKLVATYLPQAEIEVIALDSNGRVAKIRIDSPFDVKITVDGLVTNDPTAPDASKWVDVYHKYTEYAAGTTDVDGHEVITEPNLPIQIKSNGELVYLEQVTTQIPSAHLPELRGEENIKVFAQPDFGFPNPTELASAKIKVYPLTTGTLSGIEDNEILQHIKNVAATMTNIYPGQNDIGNHSSWNVLCYPGTKKASLDISTIEEHNVLSRSTTTEENSYSFANKPLGSNGFKSVITAGGKGYYTIELIQLTIYGIDYLDSITFYYNTDINVNGRFFSGN